MCVYVCVLCVCVCVCVCVVRVCVHGFVHVKGAPIRVQQVEAATDHPRRSILNTVTCLLLSRLISSVIYFVRITFRLVFGDVCFALSLFTTLNQRRLFCFEFVYYSEPTIRKENINFA